MRRRRRKKRKGKRKKNKPEVKYKTLTTTPAREKLPPETLFPERKKIRNQARKKSYKTTREGATLHLVGNEAMDYNRLVCERSAKNN